MAGRSGLDIPERHVVQKLIANAIGPIKKGLANAYCHSISALYEVAASVRDNIHEFETEESQLLEEDIDDIDQITINRIQGRIGNNHHGIKGNNGGNYNPSHVCGKLQSSQHYTKSQ